MLDLLVIVILLSLVVMTNRRLAYANETIHAKWLEQNLNRLLAYHTAFSFLFPLLPGDASGYWGFTLQQVTVHSNNMFDYFGLGTPFLLFLDFIPVKVMGLSFLTGNIMYGLLGFCGLRYLFLLYYKSLNLDILVFGVRTVPFLFYLPNLNFWTAGVGKDTLCFFGIACFVYGIQFYRRRIISMALAAALVYFIRPHVAFMMGASLAICVVFSGRMKAIYKILFLALVAAGAAVVYKQVLGYLRIEDLSTKSLSGVASDTAGLLEQGLTGSAVDIQSYPLPLKFFTYLFRPLFFDVHNVLTLVSSFENLAYLVILIKALPNLRRRDIGAMPMWMRTGLLIFLFAMVVFSSSLGNLGIIMRMKNMTMIYLLMYCTWSISRRKAELAARATLTHN
ncbi:hypothetical protein [Dinghuibacter silviterrae]|uniref:Uncharacterized protein n=1 Tax=Dinghuibacter silviterrae TaxID=1539049 RepID=A0A4R8DPM3_9BACT|nr:hypothetical protein [Dinghuibacter silviterrae]TDX00044.1 hypothetical protein EDB95_1060 [Dinghuibacter silviterrae]